MAKKGAIQMSLGMIVAVVFAIVLLSLALAWLGELIGGITDITKTLQQEASIKLESTFEDTDSNYDIWPPEYTVNPNTKLSVVAGIKNDAYDGKSHKYVVNMVVESVPSGVSEAQVTGWLNWITTPKRISINSYDKRAVDITVPANAKKGTYLFSVITCADFNADEPYDPVTLTSTSYRDCTTDSLNIWGSSSKDFTLRIE